MATKWNEGDSVQVKKTVNTAYAGSVGVVSVVVEPVSIYAVDFPNGDCLAFFEDELLATKEK